MTAQPTPEALAKKVRRAVMASMAFTEKKHPGYTHDDYDAAHEALAVLVARAAEADRLEAHYGNLPDRERILKAHSKLPAKWIGDPRSGHPEHMKYAQSTDEGCFICAAVLAAEAAEAELAEANERLALVNEHDRIVSQESQHFRADRDRLAAMFVNFYDAVDRAEQFDTNAGDSAVSAVLASRAEDRAALRAGGEE